MEYEKERKERINERISAIKENVKLVKYRSKIVSKDLDELLEEPALPGLEKDFYMHNLFVISRAQSVMEIILEKMERILEKSMELNELTEEGEKK